MKLSLAVLALIAPTEACPFKNWKRKPLPEYHCDYNASGDMEDEKYLATLQYTVYTGFVEGMYSGRIQQSFSAECLMGDKYINALKNFNALKHKVFEGDFFNISMTEAQTVADDLIESMWYNVDQCKMMVPITDAISWCGDNSDKCIHLVGLLDRIHDNFFHLAKQFWDIYEQATRDTLCENQITQLINIGKVASDVGKITAIKHGFDMEFDAERELPKESLKEQYHTAKQKVYDNWPEKIRCPFRPIFDAIHEAKAELHEFARMSTPHFQTYTPAYLGYEFHTPPQPTNFLKMIKNGYSFSDAAQVPSLHLF